MSIKNPITLTNKNCIDNAIYKTGRSKEEILSELKQDKKIESRILNLYHKKNKGVYEIASDLNIKVVKVRHVINFDNIGLSYRRVSKKNKWIGKK